MNSNTHLNTTKLGPVLEEEEGDKEEDKERKATTAKEGELTFPEHSQK